MQNCIRLGLYFCRDWRVDLAQTNLLPISLYILNIFIPGSSTTPGNNNGVFSVWGLSSPDPGHRSWICPKQSADYTSSSSCLPDRCLSLIDHKYNPLLSTLHLAPIPMKCFYNDTPPFPSVYLLWREINVSVLVHDEGRIACKSSLTSYISKLIR